MSATLIGALIDTAIPLARAVARFLLECEGILETEGPNRRAAQFLRTPAFLLDRISSEWRSSSQGLAGSHRGSLVTWRDPISRLNSIEQRLAGLVLHEWENTPSGTARRPDVLALTCALLANPAAPHTIHVVKSSLIFGLRTLYGVSNDNDTIEALKVAYEALHGRFDTQQRRRVSKSARGIEPFLIDLLCLEGSVHRAITHENLAAYYAGFSLRPLGVDPERHIRLYAGEGDWPELRGDLPDFSTVLNLAFAQPTGVPGFDEITGGLLAAVPDDAGSTVPGGVISLIAGPPGSGKTTLAMSIASRMAELGSSVAYVTTEERRPSLHAKRTAVVATHYLSRKLFADADVSNLRHSFTIVDGNSLQSLESVVAAILAPQRGKQSQPVPKPGQVYLPFPHVLVLDSITVLLGQTDETDDGQISTRLRDRLVSASMVRTRRKLAELLNELRSRGVCVFLIGEKAHLEDNKLSYLVDNVFTLDFEREDSDRHPVRIFSVDKTRLQISYRGRHVFHLARFDGCSISPSLHAVLRRSGAKSQEHGHSEARAVLWARGNEQPSLPGLGDAVRSNSAFEAITVRDRAHSLIYGWGTTGKARLAMAMAFEPRVPMTPRRFWIEHLTSRARRRSRDDDATPSVERLWFSRARVLVVSFLYPVAYYQRILTQLATARFDISRSPDIVSRRLSVVDLYPGYLDPETLIARITRELERGRLEGAPYSCVVFDGIHNILLQFPLLGRDPLLWPTLFRVIRQHGVDAISTFTFFQVASPEFARPGTVQAPEELVMVPQDAERMFHHLLVSNCDYTFLVKRIPGRRASLVLRTSSIDGFGTERDEFEWDGDSLVFSAERTSTAAPS